MNMYDWAKKKILIEKKENLIMDVLAMKVH